MIRVSSQAEFDAAVTLGTRELEIVGDITIVVTSADEICLVVMGSSQPRVEAWGSSQPRVVAWGSSQPRVEARGSSQPRVEARGSSQPRVVARESSQPRVVARESSQPRVVARESSQPRVVARESSQPRVEAWGYVQLSVVGRMTVTAGPMVSVLIDGDQPVVTGGQQTRVSARTTAEAWLEYYGVPIVDGTVTLYKAVRGDFGSGHDAKFLWTPGTEPSVPTIDDRECGLGLHFCPHPHFTLEFYSADDMRYVGCPVRVSDIRVHANPDYPTKVKAQRVCGPVFEVNEDGDPITDVASREKRARR